MIVDDGGVVREGQVETRKRAKIRKGDVLEVEGQIKITIL